MATLFVPNPTLVAQVKIDPGIGQTMAEVGEEALRAAEGFAPVESGALKDSLRRDAIPGNGQRISVNVDYWIFPEYGTVNMDAQPYLRPSLTAVGVNLI